MSPFNPFRPGDKMMYQLISVIIQLSNGLTHIRRLTTLHTNANLLAWMFWNPCYLGFNEMHVLRYPWRLLISFVIMNVPCFQCCMCILFIFFVHHLTRWVPLTLCFFQSNPLWIWITQIMITHRGQINAMIYMTSSELLSTTRIMK